MSNRTTMEQLAINLKMSQNGLTEEEAVEWLEREKKNPTQQTLGQKIIGWGVIFFILFVIIRVLISSLAMTL